MKKRCDFRLMIQKKCIVLPGINADVEGTDSPVHFSLCVLSGLIRSVIVVLYIWESEFVRLALWFPTRTQFATIQQTQLCRKRRGSYSRAVSPGTCDSLVMPLLVGFGITGTTPNAFRFFRFLIQSNRSFFLLRRYTYGKYFNFFVDVQSHRVFLLVIASYPSSTQLLATVAYFSK